MAASSFSMNNTESATVFGSCMRDAVSIESKEAAFMVLGPWEPLPPPLPACCMGVVAGFWAGGTVLPPQYKRAINIVATAIVI